MTAATKVSTCLDCATPIIGERLRCAVCHDQHAVNLLDNERSSSVGQMLDAAIGVVLFVVIIVLCLILAGRAC